MLNMHISISDHISINHNSNDTESNGTDPMILLPQQRDPNCFELDAPEVSPKPSHNNIYIHKSMINYLNNRK